MPVVLLLTEWARQICGTVCVAYSNRILQGCVAYLLWLLAFVAQIIEWYRVLACLPHGGNEMWYILHDSAPLLYDFREPHFVFQSAHLHMTKVHEFE